MKTLFTYFFCLPLFTYKKTEVRNAAASATEDSPTMPSAKKIRSSFYERNAKMILFITHH